MKYINLPIKKYLKDLGAKLPAPGGGSVTALAGAMAASLVAMTAHYTLGKDRYKGFQSRAKKILLRAEHLRKRLSELLDLDIEAYRKKDLENAINVPAQVCLSSYELAKLGEKLIYHGNKNLATDAVLAVILSESSFIVSLFYIKLNMKFLKRRNKKYQRLVPKLKSLLKEVRYIRKKVEAKVGYSIGR